MKKLLSLLLVSALSLSLLFGCNSSTPSAGTVKTGLGVINSIAKSTSAGEEDGLAQIDSTVAAVTVDANGKILSCVIDAAQTKINFDKTGKLITPTNTEFKTKNELGTEYGMGKVSSVGKEWNEQAAAFAAYVTGKTIDEVKGTAVNEQKVPTGDDLKSSVTISIGGFISVIEKAVANAKDSGAAAADKLYLTVATNIENSADAGEKPGLAQAYSTYMALTTDSAGKITSCMIDASQSNVNFDTAGQITSDLAAAPQTKDELGDSYGMKGQSGIGKEWYEQADAFAKYITGKTAADVAGIAVDETGHPTATDLTSSVTIGISDFKDLVAKIS